VKKIQLEMINFEVTTLYRYLTIRVAKLGEFSPIERKLGELGENWAIFHLLSVFLLRQFLLIEKVAQILGLLFSQGKSYVLSLTKKGLYFGF
jgi:hypothetical protein